MEDLASLSMPTLTTETKQPYLIPIAMEDLPFSSLPMLTAEAKKPKKQTKQSTRPKTSRMIMEAIETMRQRKGSSLQAIKKYIAAKYLVDTDKLAPFIKKALVTAVQSGALIQIKGNGASGSFKIPPPYVTPKKIETLHVKKYLKVKRPSQQEAMKRKLREEDSLRKRSKLYEKSIRRKLTEENRVWRQSMLQNLVNKKFKQENSPWKKSLVDQILKSSEMPETIDWDSTKEFQETSYDMSARWIVNIQHFFEEIKKISSNSDHPCGLANLDLMSAVRFGLVSRFTLVCSTCNSRFFVNSERCHNSISLNQCAVAGTMSIGCNYAKLKQLTTILNIPAISTALYNRYSSHISEKYQSLANVGTGKENRIANKHIIKLPPNIMAINDFEMPAPIKDESVRSEKESDEDGIRIEPLALNAIKTEVEEKYPATIKEEELEPLTFIHIKTEEEELPAVVKDESIDIEEAIFTNIIQK